MSDKDASVKEIILYRLKMAGITEPDVSIAWQDATCLFTLTWSNNPEQNGLKENLEKTFADGKIDTPATVAPQLLTYSFTIETAKFFRNPINIEVFNKLYLENWNFAKYFFTYVLTVEARREAAWYLYHVKGEHIHHIFALCLDLILPDMEFTDIVLYLYQQHRDDADKVNNIIAFATDQLLFLSTFMRLSVPFQTRILLSLATVKIDYEQLKSIAKQCQDAPTKSIVSQVLADELMRFFEVIDKRDNKSIHMLDKFELYHILQPVMTNALYHENTLYKKIAALEIYSSLEKEVLVIKDQHEVYSSANDEHGQRISAIAIRHRAAQYLFENSKMRLYSMVREGDSALQMINESDPMLTCQLYKNYVQKNMYQKTLLSQSLVQLKAQNAVVNTTYTKGVK